MLESPAPARRRGRGLALLVLVIVVLAGVGYALWLRPDGPEDARAAVTAPEPDLPAAGASQIGASAPVPQPDVSPAEVAGPETSVAETSVAETLVPESLVPETLVTEAPPPAAAPVLVPSPVLPPRTVPPAAEVDLSALAPPAAEPALPQGALAQEALAQDVLAETAVEIPAPRLAEPPDDVGSPDGTSVPDAPDGLSEAIPALPPLDTPLLVRVYAPGGVDPEPVVAALEAAGVTEVAVVPSRYAVSTSNLRFYHVADQAVAGQLWSRITQALPGPAVAAARDFTDFRTPPRPGTLELWLAAPGETSSE